MFGSRWLAKFFVVNLHVLNFWGKFVQSWLTCWLLLQNWATADLHLGCGLKLSRETLPLTEANKQHVLVRMVIECRFDSHCCLNGTQGNLRMWRARRLWGRTCGLRSGRGCLCSAAPRRFPALLYENRDLPGTLPETHKSRVSVLLLSTRRSPLFLRKEISRSITFNYNRSRFYSYFVEAHFFFI